MGKTGLWTCDLCGEEEKNASWPGGWGKLIDKERGDAGEETEYMVCQGCRRDLREWAEEKQND